MEKTLFQPRYDREFKKRIIEEYLTSGCAKMFLVRKYNIKFKSAIQTWMRILGYSDPISQGQRAKFGEIILVPLAKSQKNTPADLEKRVRELERLLEDEKLRSEGYSRMIEKAEKELKISIRKKTTTK